MKLADIDQAVVDEPCLPLLSVVRSWGRIYSLSLNIANAPPKGEGPVLGIGIIL